MTLSQFLRDYLYIPLGGNRKGKARRHVNLLLTMLLGGLWHGASWNFVIWGALHGAYLVINHLFRQIASPLSSGHAVWQFFVQRLSHFLTFVAVVMAWVYFRAETFFAANAMIESMLGLRGITLPEHFDYPFLILLSLLFFIVWFLPNTQSFMAEAMPTSVPDKLDAREAHPIFQWKPNMGYLLVFSTMAYFILTEIPGRVSEFIYYQF